MGSSTSKNPQEDYDYRARMLTCKGHYFLQHQEPVQMTAEVTKHMSITVQLDPHVLWNRL